MFTFSRKKKTLIDNVQDTLQNKALKLYQKCIAKPDSSLAARCCNFKMLEEKMQFLSRYINKTMIIQTSPSAGEVFFLKKQEFPCHHIHFPRCPDYELHGQVP